MNNKNDRNLALKTRRENCKKKGLCIRCFNHPSTPGFTSCESCRNSLRKRSKVVRNQAVAKQKRPEKPDKCPLCDNSYSKLYWHLYGGNDCGLYLCYRCNIMAQLADLNLVEAYRKLRSEATVSQLNK